MNSVIFATAWWHFPIITIAGFVAGAMIVTSGGGSFLTYPLLLALGDRTIVANATSTVGLWPAGLASIPGTSNEIKSNKKVIVKLLLPAFFGAILGSYLLTQTSDEVFGFIAPVLIFFGALALQFKDSIVRFSNHIRIHTPRRRIFAVGGLIFFISSYSSFFGAGVGILMLGVLSLLEVDHLVHNIAIKNILVIVSNGIAVIYFLSVGLVHWQFSLALACGSIPGGYFGAHAIHFVNEKYVRRFTVAFGLVASIVLFVRQVK